MYKSLYFQDDQTSDVRVSVVNSEFLVLDFEVCSSLILALYLKKKKIL